MPRVRLVSAAFCCVVLLSTAAWAEEPLDFARDIRPILSDACFLCHGPDKQTREADLRLDVKESAFADREGSFAFKPGQPELSEALRRITTDDPDEVMPPADSGKKLSPHQVELIRRWLKQGAPWAGHWSFEPPKKHPVPKTKNASWTRNPIDAFILARLEKEKLSPANEADKVTLLRRLSLDLVGLPPTIEEVDAFLADSSEEAYERQIERLLASPHYGERWGRHWLDAARYADSDGYEKDKQRQVWFYRDWVVNAINRDLPYDQFIIEQLAGDLLPNRTQDQLVATGFLRNSMINEEGGIDPEQFRMEAMFDRMDAIGKGVLGLTIQCAQCHDHKYDPLTQREYYQLFAFLNNSHEANIAAYTPAEQQKRAEMFRKIGEIEAELRHRTPDWRQRMDAWEKTVTQDQPAWTVLRPTIDDISAGGQKYQTLEDGSILAQGYAPTKHSAQLTVRADLPNITAVRLELLNDPNLPLGGPGRSIQGTGALSEIQIDAAPAETPDKPTRQKIVSASADIALPEKPLDAIYNDKTDKRRVTGPVAFAIDGKDETAWGIDAGPARRNLPRKAVFVFEKPISHPKGTALTFHLRQMHGGWNSDDNQNNNLGRFRLSVTSAANAVADPLPKAVSEILAIPSEKRSEAQTAAVFSYWRTTVPEWSLANSRIESLWQEHPQGSSQLTLLARSEPRDTRMLERGDFLKPKESVTAATPAFLHPMASDAPQDRLTFARWLVDRKSPTTARSLVNRVWQTYFGIGLSSTSEDLGSQSEAPSHPELLDWLSVEFMDNGWSLKKLHRLIVTSSTYRQSSKVTPELYQRDPYNRLLARGPRFRVEAEIVRDIALAASGLLNRQLGGPSVYPPAPEFLFVPPASYGPKIWRAENGPEQYRRAMYTFRYRSVPYPVLQTFDAPNGDFSCVRRARSNTPLQALMTLNEPVFMDCAKALAKRTLHEGGSTDADRLTYAFRLCIARKPTERESAVLRELLEKQARRFANKGAEPVAVAAVAPAAGSAPSTPKRDAGADQLAAWTAVCRVLLNLDETITKE